MGRSLPVILSTKEGRDLEGGNIGKKVPVELGSAPGMPVPAEPFLATQSRGRAGFFGAKIARKPKKMRFFGSNLLFLDRGR